MLHLLTVSYAFETQKIKVTGYDGESKIFAEEFGKDHPHGWIISKKDSVMENALKLLQCLEGEVDQVYEVVYISERSTTNPLGWTWDVWYRNKN